MTTHKNEPTLAELILDKKGDRSYAKLSRDCGGVPTDRRLNSLVHAPMRSFPDVETIKGLAIGLQVAVRDVLLAAARSLDLKIGADDPGSLVLPGAGFLPDSARSVLVETSRELLKMQQSIGAKRDFTNYQAQLRQDFAHGARNRRVPAVEIEGALQAAGWYMVTAEDDDKAAVEAILGWATGGHARQLKAALRDVLAEVPATVQADLELAADKGQRGIDPEAVEHTS